MLDPKKLYHEDGECCHGERRHADGACCHGHGRSHEDGECCRGEGHGHGHCHDGEEHGHGHGHCHRHGEEPGSDSGTLSEEEKVALLSYMIHHNGHHLEELNALAGELGGEAQKYLRDAVELLAQSNGRLVKALYAYRAEQERAAADDRA